MGSPQSHPSRFPWPWPTMSPPTTIRIASRPKSALSIAASRTEADRSPLMVEANEPEGTPIPVALRSGVSSPPRRAEYERNPQRILSAEALLATLTGLVAPPGSDPVSAPVGRR